MSQPLEPPQQPEPGPGQPPQPGPPPYASASPPPYAATSPDQRALWEKKGVRGIGWGVVWFLAGLIITLYTYSQASASEFGGVYVVAWGPMLYGAYRVIYGAYLLRKAKR